MKATSRPTPPLPAYFVVSLAFLCLAYGVLAGRNGWFPSNLFARAEDGYRELAGNAADGDPQWYFQAVRGKPPACFHSPQAAPGVNLLTTIERDALSVRVVDADGQVLHRWALDWFTLWPDATHVPDRLLPRERPGTHINGAVLLPDGNLVCNFEHLGLLAVDPAGRVVWRLAQQTHHSVRLAADGNLWVCGQREHSAPLAAFPGLVPPFVEDLVLVVSTKGELLREWSVLELLQQNGREGLLHLGGQQNFSTAISGDITHLNHVEPFPAGMLAGEFAPGDVLVSLRNLNTLLVFASATGRIKFLSVGQCVRQHDPHFVDGRTISVFDNRLIGSSKGPLQSRIVLLTAPTGELHEYYSGTAERPFFTPILGRHQWLPGGHLLVTDSIAGRAFELDRNKAVVWWFINYVDDTHVGAMEQAERIVLPESLKRR